MNEGTPTADLSGFMVPVVVVPDDIHKRYIAYAAFDGIPYPEFYGESQMGDGDPDNKKREAIMHLRRKFLDLLRDHADAQRTARVARQTA